MTDPRTSREKLPSAIAKLKAWLVSEVNFREQEKLRIWNERNRVYGFHGGISDEAEDDRRYAALDKKYNEEASYVSALRAAMEQLDAFAIHKFTEGSRDD